jgi:hypothetical protein
MGGQARLYVSSVLLAWPRLATGDDKGQIGFAAIFSQFEWPQGPHNTAADFAWVETTVNQRAGSHPHDVPKQAPGRPSVDNLRTPRVSQSTGDGALKVVGAGRSARFPATMIGTLLGAVGGSVRHADTLESNGRALFHGPCEFRMPPRAARNQESSPGPR